MVESEDSMYEELIQLFGRTVRSSIVCQLLENGPMSLNQFNFDGREFGLANQPYYVKNSPSTIHRQLMDLKKYDFVKKQKNGNLVLWTLNTSHPLIKFLKKSIQLPNIREAEYESVIDNFFEDIGVSSVFTTSDLRDFLTKHNINPSSARLSQLITNYINKNDVKRSKRGHFLLVQLPKNDLSPSPKGAER